MKHRFSQDDLNALRATQSGAWDTPRPHSARELATGNRKQRRRLGAAIRAGQVAPVRDY